MNPETGGSYAQVNGINLFYQSHGQGSNPLILLHGGLGSGEMFGENLALLSAGRRVITVDLQAHGRTADIPRPMSFESMADDIGALIRHLAFNQVDIMGYSLGGMVALVTALRHPGLIRKLVVVSAPCRRQGWYPEVLEGMDSVGAHAAEGMKQSPMYQHYASIAPRVEDWPVLLQKTGDLLRTEYDWSVQVAAMTIPTLLVYGDADSVSPAQAAVFFELLGGGRRNAGWDGSGMSVSCLAILPATTHYNMVTSPALSAVVTPFLS